jgi:spore coat protein U-like protein
MRSQLRCVVALMFSALAASSMAEAQTFTVGAEIVEGCALAGSPQVSGIDFGALDFGSHPAVFAGTVAAAALVGGSPVRLECTADLGFQMTVDAGQHSDGGGRRLRRSGGSEFVPYSIYTTASRATPIPAGTPLALAAPASGLVDVPVYGWLALNGVGLQPGSYTDTLQVTLSW